MHQAFKTNALLLAATTATVMACFTSPSHAIQPGKWTQTTEADFANGDPIETVVTNLGDIRLTSATKTIADLPEGVTIIEDAITIDGVTYVAAGPEATLLKIVDGKAEVVATFEDQQVFCLAELNGSLLVGISGETSYIGVLHEGEVKSIAAIPAVKAEDDGADEGVEEAEAEKQKYVRYLWDMVAMGDDLAIATGEDAQVVKLLDAAGAVKGIKAGQELEPPAFETLLSNISQTNILCLAADTNGNLFAGTDTDGLIYRIDDQGIPFVVFDAPEAEVAALFAAANGTVYAGTAAADQARPGRLAQPVQKETGRDEAMPDDEVDAPENPQDKPADGEEQPGQPEGDGGDPANEQPGDQPADEPAEEQSAEEQPEEQEEEKADPKPQKPTAEQYDRLRDEMQQRLVRARETGEFDVAVDGGAPLEPAAVNQPSPQRPSRARPAAPVQQKQGNAVYEIDPQGFVREVFRESSMILSIAAMPGEEGKLLVTTGNEGQVFSIDPAINEHTLINDLESQQVMVAVPTDAGLLLGGANPAQLLLMDQGLAETGSYTSQVLDAGQISMFGVFKLTAEIPQGCFVKVETRSGNVGDPEKAAWSKWSEAGTLEADPDTNALQPRELEIDAPPARYLQYRLTLTSSDGQTPVVDEAELAYVSPNIPPQIAALNLNIPEPGEPGSAHDPNINIAWQAADANSDRLVFNLEYRPAGSKRYLPLAEDLTDPRFQWKTQHVPDGWYTLRVIASDKLDNPTDMARRGARSSEPVLVDNTAPSLEGLKAEMADGKVVLKAKATDKLSAISSVAYSINGSDEYQATLPKDLIFDSTSEEWAATISDLSPGEHVIAVRVIDARGNTAYEQLIVTVE